MALGDITIYSKDNGNGYPGDVNYQVATGATVPQILSGEPVMKTLGSGSFAVSMSSGSGAQFWPQVKADLGPTSVFLLGVAASTSNETTSGNINGQVSVTPIDEPITYLISTQATTPYFGNPSSGFALQQQQYDTNVGARVTLDRQGGVGSAQLGGTYYIKATDTTGNGCIVEELDVAKFPGKVRFSFRTGLSYRI